MGCCRMQRIVSSLFLTCGVIILPWLLVLAINMVISRNVIAGVSNT